MVVSFLPLIIVYALSCLVCACWNSFESLAWNQVEFTFCIIREKLFKCCTGAPILLLFFVCMFSWSFAFGPGKVSFVWWLYHIPLLSVFCTVLSVNLLWDFLEEICEFGAAFDYSWESVRRNTESLGFCTWLFPGLVFIVPRKSTFPSSILIHFLTFHGTW